MCIIVDLVMGDKRVTVGREGPDAGARVLIARFQTERCSGPDLPSVRQIGYKGWGRCVDGKVNVEVAHFRLNRPLLNLSWRILLP